MQASIRFVVFFACLMLPLFALAQEPDSIRVQPASDSVRLQTRGGFDITTDSLTQKPVVEPLPHTPAKAAFYSAVLPGLGQAYNGNAWKIPIIYAGFTYVVYAVDNYNQLYSQNLRNLEIIQSDPTINEINNQDEGFYRSRADRYRRERDFSIILGCVLYGLNIVEAYVDAHLQTFDLSEDISMKVQPTLIPSPYGTANAGLKVSISLP